MMPAGAPQEDPNAPYPGVGTAVLLTLMAFVAALFTGVALYPIGPLAAYGIGRAIGVGAVASMAAQRVGEPQARRLGMTRLELDAVPLILCLVPAMLLMSELDNIAYDWGGGAAVVEQGAAPSQAGEDTGGESELDASDGELAALVGESEAIEQAAAPSDEDEADGEGETASGAADRAIFDPEDPFSLLQALVVLVGIIPLVDCFLYFGVIQQGLVRRLGFSQGLMITAILWTVPPQVVPVTTAQVVAATFGYVALGHLLGWLRIATGSVAGPMLLASGWAAIQFVSLATYDRIPLPGLNVPGTHLPFLVTLGCVGIVGWAATTLYAEAARRHAEDDVWRGPGPRPRPRRLRAVEDAGAEIHPFPPVPRPKHLDRPEGGEGED